MKKKFVSGLFFLLTGCLTVVAADQSTDWSTLLNKGVKYQLSEDGSSYTSFSMATQFWARYTALNAGSLNTAGDAVSTATDMALRRSRFVVYTNLNDRLVFYTQLGFNNLSASGTKPQLFFHDMWGMVRLIPTSLYVGFGLNGWNGLSRLSNTSYQTTLTLDNPGVNYPTVNRTDLEARQLGLFLKGSTNRFSYRYIVSKPFEYTNVPLIPLPDKGYAYPSEALNVKGYVAYNFWDKESFTTPYVSMTYLGAKKICNVGVGFDWYPDAVAQYDVLGTRTLSDRTLVAADFMLEMPMAGKQALTFYAVHYWYDFGKNYISASGTMNRWSGGSAVEGAGNNEYKTGTGNITYASAGYLFPERFLKLPGRVQAFYALTDKQFEAIGTDLYNHDFGFHYYMAGQKLKLSFQYSLRPVLENTLDGISGYKPTAIAQLQLAI